ncbi:MAG: hypothetical protein NW206_15380 [Hyphomonadaceae bacterium]|nr:hypothetical protein [Hyphomonadaceae bacterium]
MRALISAAVIAASLATATTPAFAEWRQIGQREVSDRAERDVIAVEGHQQFERIRICVYRNPVHFRDLDIVFRNGGHQDAAVREIIPAGGCTRAIDLVGDDRDIARIAVAYEETSRRRAHAHVRVFAE